MANILLDTNALLWWFSDDPRLGDAAVHAIELESNSLYVSEISLFEVSIKVSLGKLRVIPGFLQKVAELTTLRLSISDDDLKAYEKLPFVHRDPFDRMLIAQAQTGGFTILTSDDIFKDYSVPVIDLRR